MRSKLSLLLSAVFALTLVSLSPVTASEAASAMPAVPDTGAWTKPLAAGAVVIDPVALEAGTVSVATEPVDGLEDASVTVNGTGEAGATTESSVRIVEAESAGDPAEAVLADASGSTVVATLSGTTEDGSSVSSSDTVWVDEFEGQTLVSESGEQDLRLQRLGVLRDNGTITAAEATDLESQIRGGGAAHTESFVPGTCVDLCVGGTILWTDSAGGTHPVDRAPVQIREDNAGTDDVITTVTTDGTGAFTATINNTDPEGGDRDVYVRVLAEGPGINIHAPAVVASHFIDGAVDANIPDGSVVTQNLTANNTLDNNTAFAVQASLVFAEDGLTTLNGSPLPVPVVFPTNLSTSLYDGTSLHILQLDRWDWDVSLHEFGHYVADQINIEDNPGGNHSGGDNLSDSRGSKAIGIPLAFGEGWPTFFAVSTLHETAVSAGIPNIGDTSYQDTEDQVITNDLEGTHTLGEDNEVTNSSILWDLYDAVNDGRDTTSLGAQSVWDTLNDNDPTTLSAAYRLFSPNRSNEGVNCIFTQMNVAPRVDGPATVSSTPPTIRWRRGNGGTHKNNSFSVAFRSNTGALLFTSPFRNGQSYRPTQARWTSLRNHAGGTVKVSVVGRQTDNPATGPYRSCTKSYSV